MGIKDYLDEHRVFTARDFTEAFPGSVTDRNLLMRAVQSGKVDRVRRGLYVSKAGQFSHSEASVFDVATAAADDAIFCYLSALQLYGVLYNVVFVTQFYTAHKIARFTYAGQGYRPEPMPVRTLIPSHTTEPDPSNPLAWRMQMLASGASYRVTTREQTVLDGLASPGRVGGPENLLRSIGGFQFLNVPELVEAAVGKSKSMQAKLGWVLEAKQEDWGVTRRELDVLAKNVRGGPYYFSSSRQPKDSHWVPRWRLYLPHPEQEMEQWLVA